LIIGSDFEILIIRVMLQSIFKIGAAAILFAGVHSLLAGRSAKRTTTQLLGVRRRNAFYRPFYNVAALLTFGALVLYGIKLSDRELYRVRKPLSGPMRLIQIFFLIYLIYAAKQVGFLQFSGITNLMDWIGGRPIIRKEPEAQGAGA
jgi:hypothetical protein